jgi:hypothetical protein
VKGCNPHQGKRRAGRGAGHRRHHPADARPLTSCDIECAFVDKGYRGNEAPNPRRIFISGQKCGVFGVIKHEFRRRSTIELGHMKKRVTLAVAISCLARDVLCAVGYNFRRILAWLKTFCVPSSTLRLGCLMASPCSTQFLDDGYRFMDRGRI